MFERNCCAIHRDLMEYVSYGELRERYFVQKLLRDGELVQNYTHGDRNLIDSMLVGLPRQGHILAVGGGWPGR